MNRSLFSALALVAVFAGPANATDTSLTDYTRVHVTLGLGAGFPHFETEDNAKAGFAMLCRLSIFPRGQSSFGGWLDFDGSFFGSDSRHETVVLPNIVATGEHDIQRSNPSIHLGIEYVPNVRHDTRIRPRFALGGGIGVFTATERIEIDGITYENPIELRRKYSVVPEVSTSIGVMLPEPEGLSGTVSVDFTWHYGGKVELNPGEASESETLSAFTLFLSYMWSSSPPGQRHRGKDRDKPMVSL